MMSTISLEKERLLGKNFLTLGDFEKHDILFLINEAIRLKKEQKEGKSHPLLAGKTLAMIFEKPSTRTRASFEVGMFQLGGHALFLSKEDVQLGNGETIADTAKTLSRYVDVMMIRTFDHEYIIELATHATVPVINGLTDEFHPCQVLADLMTIVEKRGTLNNQSLVYVGDGNNMAHSLLMGCAVMGMNCTIVTPQGYEVKEDVFMKAKQRAAKSGAVLEQTNKVLPAVTHADIIYTDVWASMGWEDEADTRVHLFKDYQVNDQMLAHAKDDCLFFHCLPAHRGEEVTASVIDGPQSVVFDQAENRLHAQKAILTAIVE